MEAEKLTLVCSQCQAVNRIPQERLRDGPICGSCRSKLTTNEPMVLDDNNFEKVISRTSLIVIVDFWAGWCRPCMAMAPAYAAAASQLAPEFVLAKLDTEQAQQTAMRFHIAGIPCLIAFRDGVEIARSEGALGTEQIVSWVRSVGK